MKVDFTLPSVELSPELSARVTESNATAVARCSSDPRLQRVADRWARVLQPLGTIALGAVLVIIGMLVLGGDDPARWYVIGGAAAVVAGFGLCLWIFRQSMRRTFHRLVRQCLAEE